MPLLPFYSPLENTLHKTGVEGDGAMSAGGALIQMAPLRRRTAAQDGVDDFQMQPGKPLSTAVEKRVSCRADNVGHLQRWPGHLMGLRCLCGYCENGQCI